MSWLLRKLKLWEDRESRDKTTFTMRNGASVLKELIAASNGKYNPYRIFSDEELKIATNNYDDQNFIEPGHLFKLYKGIWQERSITVMRFLGFIKIRETTHKRCINNIVYAAQMSHKHILKLIGCCLETPVPILVFESVEYRTLPERIGLYCYPRPRPRPQFEPLLLKHRLKIAVDIAHALAYLHVGFPRPIVFRHFKPSHISFNEQYVAKLFDFSFCISIPEGETHVQLDRISGVMAYMAPEYIHTLLCNEKCDVYSFGVFLLELLFGREARDDLHRAAVANHYRFNLMEYVKKAFEDNRFSEMVDPMIFEDISCTGKEQQLESFKQLALKCVDLSPEDRPTMVDVGKQLRQIYRSYI